MKILSNLKYTKTHEWAKFEDDGTVLAGLTDFAQEHLGDLVFVNLPEVGDPVTAGEPFCDVESVKAVSDVYAPVSGEIIEVNEALADNPALINEGPYDAENTEDAEEPAGSAAPASNSGREQTRPAGGDKDDRDAGDEPPAAQSSKPDTSSADEPDTAAADEPDTADSTTGDASGASADGAGEAPADNDDTGAFGGGDGAGLRDAGEVDHISDYLDSRTAA